MGYAEPLAYRMRPDTLDDIIGQQHILGKNMLLRRLIESDILSSIILYGPPGTGKTTIANVIAHTTKSNFKSINATTAGKKICRLLLILQKKNSKIPEQKQYCSLTRFTDSTKPNRIICCRM